MPDAVFSEVDVSLTSFGIEDVQQFPLLELQRGSSFIVINCLLTF
jgi:hypothetical protein